MLKYNLIVLIFPLFLFSQEQVSDIEYNGVYKATFIGSKVGFALIDGTQYLLKENDSLGIYKFENGTFNYFKTVDKGNCKPKISNVINPNRSIFEIRGRYYYRFLMDELQIVDIVLGTIVDKYDFSEHDIAWYTPTELHQNRFYFSGRQNSVHKSFMLDLNTGELEIVDKPSGRVNAKQSRDHLVGIEENKKAYVFNAFTKVDTLIFESSLGIRQMSFSEQDSSYVILEEDGSLWKVDKDLNLFKTTTVIPNMSKFKNFKANGDKVIAIYDHLEVMGNSSGNINRQDNVIVLDIISGQEEITFTTGIIQYYANYIQYVTNENFNQDFSIFGFTGEDPTDGLNEGLYYVLDHKKNTATAIDDLSTIVTHTPIVHKNAIYAVGKFSSYWGSSTHIIKHDLNTFTTSKLYPNSDNNTKIVKLGFVDSDDLVVATNITTEDPNIWKIKSNKTFNHIQSIDFLYNLGINYLSKVLPMEDRIYFTNNVGLYSVLDDSKSEIIFENNAIVLDGQVDTELAAYNNDVVIPERTEGGVKFKIINTETGAIDSTVENNVKPWSGSLKTLGSSIYYSGGNSGDSLHIFDFKTKSIRVIDEVRSLISSRLTKGEKSAIYLHTPINTSNRTVYHIDYETYTFKALDLDLEYYVNVAAGFDNSFYFMDRASFNDGTRIQLLKDNGEVSTIYNDYGRPYSGTSVSSAPDIQTATINLTHNDSTSIIISNNLQSTYVFEMPNLSRNDHDFTLINEHQGKYILQTTDSLGDHYWFYEAFSPVVKIETPIGDRIAFSDLTDSLAVLMFTSVDSVTSLIKFDYKNLTEHTIDGLKFECGISYYLDKLAITSSKYLVSGFCDSEREPHILDIDDGTLTLLADINVGTGSSNPTNYLRYKDWIYFTATLKDKSKQWFRLETDPKTNVLETVNDDRGSLNIFPSPSSSNIFINQDLEEVVIYSIGGQMLLREINYKTGNAISINDFQGGSYIVIAKNRNNEILKGKFVKVD